jgi:Flp pilus assembly protein TadG
VKLFRLGFMRLLRDRRGNSSVEFALAIPVLTTLMIGILQFGIVLHVNGELRYAVGEGLRFAKIYPQATDAQVIAKTRDALVNIDQAGITGVQFQRGTVNGARYGRITVNYQAQPIVPFIPSRIIALSETAQAYLQT